MFSTGLVSCVTFFGRYGLDIGCISEYDEAVMRKSIC